MNTFSDFGFSSLIFVFKALKPAYRHQDLYSTSSVKQMGVMPRSGAEPPVRIIA